MGFGFKKSKAPKRTSEPFCFNKIEFSQMARVTLPERKQRVQAYTLRGEPLTIALTLLTLGFHVLLERLCEWETLIPKETSLLQNSHFAIELHLLL